jgi:hypothetical protein
METPDTGPACCHHNTHVEWKEANTPFGFTGEVGIDIRGRAYRISAGAVLAFAAVLASLLVLGGTPAAAIALVPLVPVAVRMALVWVHTDGDRLHVHNFWSTFELPRSGIDHFEVADLLESRAGRQRTVYAHLRGGRPRRLSATKSTYRKLLSFSPRPGARNEADDMCDALDAWLRTGA